MYANRRVDLINFQISVVYCNELQTSPKIYLSRLKNCAWAR